MHGPIQEFAMINKTGFISAVVLFLLMVIAMVAPLIANDIPLKVREGDHTYYPAWAVYFGRQESKEIVTPSGREAVNYQRYDWKNQDWDEIVMPWIPFAPDELDARSSSLARPGTNDHLLGTDRIGRDVLSGIIHGSRISLTIGWIAMGIAALIGVFLGGLSGYLGNASWSIPSASFWSFWVFLPMGWFYAGIIHWPSSFLYGVVFLGIPLGSSWLIGKISFFRKHKMLVPVDSIITRVTEILTSLPRLLIIITIASITSRSIWMVMVIIGLTSWTHIARYTRAEVLRIRGLEYISAAEAAGLKKGRIIIKHTLPNALAPVWVNLAFGIASAILIESGLSFLGIGVPVETVTWGSMLNLGRLNFEAWWLVVFPGTAIFITVTAYNLLGESLRKWLQPKERS